MQQMTIKKSTYLVSYNYLLDYINENFFDPQRLKSSKDKDIINNDKLFFSEIDNNSFFEIKKKEEVKNNDISEISHIHEEHNNENFNKSKSINLSKTLNNTMNLDESKFFNDKRINKNK